MARHDSSLSGLGAAAPGALLDGRHHRPQPSGDRLARGSAGGGAPHGPRAAARPCSPAGRVSAAPDGPEPGSPGAARRTSRGERGTPGLAAGGSGAGAGSGSGAEAGGSPHGDGAERGAGALDRLLEHRDGSRPRAGSSNTGIGPVPGPGSPASADTDSRRGRGRGVPSRREPQHRPAPLLPAAADDRADGDECVLRAAGGEAGPGLRRVALVRDDEALGQQDDRGHAAVRGRPQRHLDAVPAGEPLTTNRPSWALSDRSNSAAVASRSLALKEARLVHGQAAVLDLQREAVRDGLPLHLHGGVAARTRWRSRSARRAGG